MNQEPLSIYYKQIDREVVVSYLKSTIVRTTGV